MIIVIIIVSGIEVCARALAHANGQANTQSEMMMH